MRIGICGTGNMGSAMGERLIKEGRKLSVWNRTYERTHDLLEQGAAFATNPAALAAGCDVVISMVIDDDAIASVYEGEAGLLSADLGGTLIIEMSTIRPDTVVRIAKGVAEAGGRFLECPVGGSVQPALNGQLLGLAGGEAEVVEAARPVLEQLCRRLDHVGPVGAGAAMKLAVNLPLVVYWEAVGEALAIADKAGIDLVQAADILGDTSGTIKVAPGRLPRIVDVVKGERPDGAAFSMAGMAKDLRLMSSVAAGQGIAAPVTDAASASYEAAVADGWGEREGVLLAAWRVIQTSDD
ncbi:MAG: NAD(P)-dependent oxidoreductase [Alphaproteobacteria bacterium]|nr:NAD(P)-dependent oxidoreductase [Alphaproteobacteria bacterium]